MDKTDPSGGHSAIDTAKQGTAVLSISQFARICKDTTDANYKTGKSADTMSEKDLALLLAHGDAGGVVSIAMAAEMQRALFARVACEKARAFLHGRLDFPTEKQRDAKGRHFAQVEGKAGKDRGYCRVDFESRWRHLQYAAVKKGKPDWTPKTTRECGGCCLREVEERKGKGKEQQQQQQQQQQPA